MGPNGEKIVYTSGTWDLFHIGHLEILRKSKALGDILIVGVSTDELVKSYKFTYPVIGFEDRFKIIDSIKYVDITVKQTILTEIEQLKQYNIDIVTIGDDWKNKYLEGLEWMKKNGKTVVYFPYTPNISSTIIKQKLYNQ